MPWKRTYKSASEGKYDGAAFFVCTPERQKLFYCSKTPVSKDQFFFAQYKTESSPLVDKVISVNSLTNVKIDLVGQYFYEKDFKSIAKKKTPTEIHK